MSERRKLAEKIYSILSGEFFHNDLYMRVHTEERKQKIIDVIETKMPDIPFPDKVGLCQTCFDRICTDCQDRLTGNYCAKCGTVPEFSTKDPNFCRNCGSKFERPKKDPYILGLRNSEVQNLIDEKFSIYVRHFRDGEMETVLNHVVHEFNWKRVYEQIENIDRSVVVEPVAVSVDEPRIGMGGNVVGAVLKRLGQPDVVAVEQGQQSTRRLLDGRIARVRQPLVFLVDIDDLIGVALLIRSSDLLRIVG